MSAVRPLPVLYANTREELLAEQDEKERDVHVLQLQVVMLEDALKASQKEAEVAIARTRARARVLQRKVEASVTSNTQVSPSRIKHHIIRLHRSANAANDSSSTAI